jgi:formyltetrahydrofolate hydrolase
MAERSRNVAVLISGRGSNMAALIYAARADDCPYEVALVTGDKPDAPGLDVARAEGVRGRTPRCQGARPMPIGTSSLQQLLEERAIDLIALAGFMRIIPDEFLAAGKAGSSTSTPRCCPSTRASRPTKPASPAATRQPARPSTWSRRAR